MVEGNVLVVEDDLVIGSGLRTALGTSGFEVRVCATGRDALEAVSAWRPDVVLLDLGLPDIDGQELCQALRHFVGDAAIIVLTARSDELEVVIALDNGADDYVTKPFRLMELLARIRANLRRTAPGRGRTLAVGDLVVDRDARTATFGSAAVVLRPKEFDLLCVLMSSVGRAVTRERLMDEVWDEHWDGSTKTLDVHVSSLRRKLAEAGGPLDLIATLRGVGYRLEAGTRRPSAATRSRVNLPPENTSRPPSASASDRARDRPTP